MLDYLVVYDRVNNRKYKKNSNRNFCIPSGDVQRSDKSS